jgi:hypothetical protein
VLDNLKYNVHDLIEESVGDEENYGDSVDYPKPININSNKEYVNLNHLFAKSRDHTLQQLCSGGPMFQRSSSQMKN